MANDFVLPALSSISTRREMRPLQERLSANYHAVAADRPMTGRDLTNAIKKAYEDFSLAESCWACDEATG